MKSKFIFILFLAFMFLGTSASAATFKGRVIDADTKEPIEGAVVVAKWQEGSATISGEDTKLKDVKETLTDKNGEWKIKGPRGREGGNITALFTFLTGTYYTRPPLFIIYKPGYVSYPTMFGMFGCFLAYPYVDKESNIEGIVLVRLGDTKEEREKYIKEQKKHSSGSFPFIPVEDSERKLRNLDFSFEYPKNVKWIGGQETKTFKAYTVVGLKKAKTKEDRRRALPTPIHKDGDREFYKKQRKLISFINEESRYLGIPEYKTLKEFENEE